MRENTRPSLGKARALGKIQRKPGHGRMGGEEPSGKSGVLRGYKPDPFVCLFLIFCEPAVCAPRDPGVMMLRKHSFSLYSRPYLAAKEKQSADFLVSSFSY